jgi:hypothetical protein
MTPPRDAFGRDGALASVSTLVRESRLLVRGAGFWAAILLPVVYVPLVLLGHPWVTDVTNFSKLIGLHVASLVVGRGYAGDVDVE